MRVKPIKNLPLDSLAPNTRPVGASQQVAAPETNKGSLAQRRGVDSYLACNGGEAGLAESSAAQTPTSVTQRVALGARANFSFASTRDRAKAVFGAILDVDQFSDADVNHLLRKVHQKGAIVGLAQENDYSFPDHYTSSQCEVLMVWGPEMAAKLSAKQCDALMGWRPANKRGPRTGPALISLKP